MIENLSRVGSPSINIQPVNRDLLGLLTTQENRPSGVGVSISLNGVGLDTHKGVPFSSVGTGTNGTTGINTMAGQPAEPSPSWSTTYRDGKEHQPPVNTERAEGGDTHPSSHERGEKEHQPPVNTERAGGSKAHPPSRERGGRRSTDDRESSGEQADNNSVICSEQDDWSDIAEAGYGDTSAHSVFSHNSISPINEPQISNTTEVSELVKAVNQIAEFLESKQFVEKTPHAEIWLDTETDKVTFDGERVTYDGLVYSYTRSDEEPHMILLGKPIQASEALSAKTELVVESIKKLFNSSTVEKSGAASRKVIHAPVDTLAVANRVFKELHLTYTKMLTSFHNGRTASSHMDTGLHKEFSSKKCPVLVYPKTPIGLMSPEQFESWAKDEPINLRGTDLTSRIHFEVTCPKNKLDDERMARMELLKLHHLMVEINQYKVTNPSMGDLMASWISQISPHLYSATKRWMYAKFLIRKIVLQVQRNIVATALMESSPWMGTLFDFEGCRYQVTNRIQEQGWAPALGITERVAKLVAKRPQILDLRNNKINMTKSHRQPFRGTNRGSSTSNSLPHRDTRGNKSTRQRFSNSGFSKTKTNGNAFKAKAEQRTAFKGNRATKGANKHFNKDRK